MHELLKAKMKKDCYRNLCSTTVFLSQVQHGAKTNAMVA